MRIDYNGVNKPPVVQLTADKTSGALPLGVRVSSKGTQDPDENKLTYELEAGGKTLSLTDGNFDVRFDTAG